MLALRNYNWSGEPAPPPEDLGSDVGLIVGVTIGVLVVILVITERVVFYRKRYRAVPTNE